MAIPSGESERSGARTPIIEVNVTHEHGPAPSTRRLREAVEVITRNHVYVLDSALTCIEVRSAGSGERVPDAPFVGSRLVGGQLNTAEATELSHPFPRPGALAVFEVARGHARQ
ncbi:MAG TPA: hypothetical protein VKZ63_19845, partial [Kofleriaceae bacterium]|nr:hypothetical protein [Kofleriaceae bacterium]